MAALTLLLALAQTAPAVHLGPGERSLPLPAGPGARWPSLCAGADGELYASWVEPAPPQADGSWTLALARLEGETWVRLADAARGRDWFVNWADFPSVAALADGTLATYWLAKSDAGTYEYEVLMTLSLDGGASWIEPFCLHEDRAPAEHGFVSLAPFGERFAAVWLDGRATPDGGAMQLRARTVAPVAGGGPVAGAAPDDPRAGPVLGPELLLDERVCDCCQTALVPAGEGLAAAWRDRGDDEVRDMSWAPLDRRRLDSGEPGPGAVKSRSVRPRPVARDGWKIAGCPVNGPALDCSGDALLAAWFTTGDDDRPRVLVRRLGRGEPGPVIELDAADPLGRVDLVHDGDATWVSWLERTGPSRAAWMLVRLDAELEERERSVLAELESAGRDTGFGRLARHGDHLYFAWTEPADEDDPGVRCLRLER